MHRNHDLTWIVQPPATPRGRLRPQTVFEFLTKNKNAGPTPLRFKAQRLLSQQLKRWGLKPTELQLRPKGDEAKVKVAAQLRSQTTMSWAWIAQELAMGSGGYVANCVRALSKE